MLLPDRETTIDLLNYEPIAASVARLIREERGQPITIGIHGDWGAGKSSVLEMVEQTLKDDQAVVCLRFNGWQLQGFEDAKIALIEGIVTGLLDARPDLAKAGDFAKDLFARIDWLKLAKLGGGLGITATTGFPSPGLVSGAIDELYGLLTGDGPSIDKNEVTEVVDTVSGLLKPAESRQLPTEVREFRAGFDQLLHRAKIEQLVVFVDDLDRCLPHTAIETLEAIRLFILSDRTAFVIAADDAMIEYSVRQHFPDLPETTGPSMYAKNYLEKLIQVPFRLPSLGDVETRIYVTLLLISAEVDTETDAFRGLISTARERLQRPWLGALLTTDDVDAAFGRSSEQVKAAMLLSDQIGAPLARGARGNPRQIKRFLNAMLLRQLAASARGIADDIAAPVLAKLMLAERFQSRAYGVLAEQAVASAEGKPSLLTELERVAGKRPEEKPDDLPQEWWESEALMTWARLDPPLAAVDLRPYLFISKDRRIDSESSVPAGHLQDLAERLLGSSVAIAAVAGDVASLTTDEAVSVFTAISGRIRTHANLKRRPEGIDGLVAIVKNHDAIEPHLLDFLESLPAESLGGWVLAGWEGVISSEIGLGRLRTLFNHWAQQDANKNLARLAETRLRQMAGG